MKKIFFTANILMVLALASCNQKAEQKTETAPLAEPAKIEIKLADLSEPKDFVCGMPLDEGGIADTTSYEGKVYGFCASECKAEFLKNPSTYLAQK